VIGAAGAAFPSNASAAGNRAGPSPPRTLNYSFDPRSRRTGAGAQHKAADRSCASGEAAGEHNFRACPSSVNSSAVLSCAAHGKNQMVP
jgi:hypothetical protein